MNINQKQFCLGDLGKYAKKAGTCDILGMNNRILVLVEILQRNRITFFFFFKEFAQAIGCCQVQNTQGKLADQELRQDFFFFLATPKTCRSSSAKRDRIHATAVTRATAVATARSLTTLSPERTPRQDFYMTILRQNSPFWIRQFCLKVFSLDEAHPLWRVISFA